VTDHDDAEPGPDDAQGFEDIETSPELRVRLPRDDGKPTVIIGSANGKRRRKIVEMLWADGWNAVEAHDAEELLEMTKSLAPQVLLVDAELRDPSDAALPETVRHQRPDAALRSVALIEGSEADRPEKIARALADGYDDFVADVDNDVETLARATANLRAARTLAQVNRQRRDAALLLELTQTLASSLDMQLILHTVSRLIAEVVGYERCSIILLDPNDDDAIMVAASEDRAVRDLHIRLSNYPEVKRCVESAAPVLIDDVSADPMLAGVSQSLLSRGVHKMALFPLVFEEGVTGVLFLRAGAAMRPLSSHELQFAQTVAAACAVAIRNARIFDTFRDQNQAIESMRAQAERQNEALKKYQDFFEYAADGISVIDFEGRIHYANKEGRRLLGRSRDELKDFRFQELLVEESARLWHEVVAQVRHGRFKRFFDVYVAVAGEERVFSLSAGGVGQGTGLLILSFRDVTEMREMEGELRTTKEFLENLIDNSVDAIVAADMNGNIMLFNKGAEAVYGYSAEDVIGVMHVTQLYPHEGAYDVMRRLRDERWGGRGRLAPERREILTAEGVAVPVSMSASIIYEDGEEVATVGVFADLRDRMAIERQLNEAKEQLTKAEKGRVAAELAGMAAHELNQPLTSVLGYAEMLKARIPEGDQRLRRPVETIFKQAERMAEIVRKIGRVTKYETKRYGANTDMIDLNRAAGDDGADRPRDDARITADNLPTISTPGTFQGVGERPEDAVTLPPAHRDGVAAALMKKPSSTSTPQTDPRAAVVRMDTVEDAPGYARSLQRGAPPQAPQKGDTESAITRRNLRPPSEPSSSPSTSTPSASTMPSAPRPRSIGLDVPAVSEADEHTNPGVRLSELRKRAEQHKEQQREQQQRDREQQERDGVPPKPRDD
jgi:PAS domain S-box-containing protein